MRGHTRFLLRALQKYLLLSSLGLMRHTDSLDPLLTLCQAITHTQEPLFGWHSPKQHILDDLARIHRVKPATLIAQGLTGKALGEALKKSQIAAL